MPLPDRELARPMTTGRLTGVMLLLWLGGCAAGPTAPGTGVLATPERGNPAEWAEADRRSELVMPETRSLLGEPLFPPPREPREQAQRERALAAAQAEFDRNPNDEQAIIWLGRRLAYVGRYNDAVAVFTRGLSIHPDSYRLLRHRGHRFITLRRFSAAISDLLEASDLIDGVADAVEPDGLPNDRGIPRSTTHSNIWYHLGLAYYLRGDFQRARRAYEHCMEFSANDDMRCATSYWLYLSLRRLGEDEEAQKILEPIAAGMEIFENTAYHALLLMFKGERTPEDVLGSNAADWIDDATVGYGVGAWHLLEGEEDQALEIFRRIVAGAGWPAFGHIAAEAELARRDSISDRRP